MDCHWNKMSANNQLGMHAVIFAFIQRNFILQKKTTPKMHIWIRRWGSIFPTPNIHLEDRCLYAESLCPLSAPPPQVLIIESEYPNGRQISNTLAKNHSVGHGYPYLHIRKPTKIIVMQYTH